jgi:cell division protein FtsB
MDWYRRRVRTAEEAVEPDTDARAASGRPEGSERDPETARRRSLGRWALRAALWTVFLGGGLIALIGEGGWLELHRLRAERIRLEADLSEESRRIEALREEVRQLREGRTARERIAREQLGLVRPGEVTILLPKEGEPPPP